MSPHCFIVSNHIFYDVASPEGLGRDLPCQKKAML